ncbi:MAG: ABC transporter ATP-binding protein [Thermoproteota archaeon]|nr:ABC transporter ATP-binding protein [Candidatus Brockarchaeota archaeon]
MSFWDFPDNPGSFFQRLFYSLSGRGSTPLRITAVDNVNFTVRRGEIMGLLGPNGSGKSTLLKLLACLILPSKGTASILGYDIVKEPSRAIEQVNFVPGLLTGGIWISNRLSARQNLEHYANLFRLSRADVDRALELSGLADRADERAATFSSGMIARLMLAIGLLRNTPVFLMDEPTAGIDPQGAKEIRQYLKDHLCKRLGITILMATHNVSEAQDLFDRVCIMNKGRIIAIDTVQNLIRSISEVETIRIDAKNINQDLIKRLERIDGVDRVAIMFQDPQEARGTIRIHTKDHREVLPRAIDLSIKEYDLKIEFVEISQPDLEDVFINLTGSALE